ncbi:MAG: NAD(P)-binding domain-containing protein [Saprospiraceae bacterium]
MKIGILGSGVVGVTLANGFIKKNYSVMIGTNSVEKIPADISDKDRNECRCW